MFQPCDEQGNTVPCKGVVLTVHGNLIFGVLNCLISQANTPRNALFVHENAAFTHLELHYDAASGK